MSKDPSRKIPPYEARIEQRAAPLVDPGMGARFKLVRMRMLMEQAEIGEMLGCSQTQVSRLERGHMDHAPFTLARLRAVVGVHFEFILFGRGNAEAWSPHKVHSDYWEFRLKTNRKEGSGKWKTEQRQAGIKYYWKKNYKNESKPE